ncbi:MAG: pyridoxine 5'-phosphate synthase [Gammaproteobacteria bacterium]|nr:pyridoxine 5'-phosphate synthase [Gammaproteobacteria bacterium]
MNEKLLLGVNIDHVASVRQARGTPYPSPLEAALAAEQAGADGITLHLREDRRHIQDADVYLFKKTIQTKMNLEMAVTDEMIAIAEAVKPEDCCLVPEKREELTTEGGLDVCGNLSAVKNACQKLAASDITVSLFIDADREQIDAAVEVGAPVIEIHTGHFADANSAVDKEALLAGIIDAANYADSKGLIVNAGHGLHYDNVKVIAAIPVINELNIGHTIISRALFVGMKSAVAEMKLLMQQARQ